MSKEISGRRCASIPSVSDLRRLVIAGCWLFCVFGLVSTGDAQQPRPVPLIWSCDKPFMFGFGSWEKTWKEPRVGKSGIRVVAASGQGGAGIGVLHRNLDGCGDFAPALTVKVTDKHKAKGLFLVLTDADGTSHKYSFDLSKLQPGVPQQILALEGASLTEPSAVDKPGTVPGLDLSKIDILLFVGDWSGDPFDLTISAVSAVRPTKERLAQRAKLRERLAREAKAAAEQINAQERARQELLTKGAKHLEDGPEVTRVCAVAADVLAVVLQAGKHVNNELKPYDARPGDEIEEEQKDQPRHLVKDGKVVDYCQKALYRTVDKKRTRVGLISPDGKWLFVERSSSRQLLEETIVDLPAAYTIHSADDPALATPKAPAAIFRKGKPNGFSQPLPFLYTISLKLPSPLKEGAAYTIRLAGVNTCQETVTYVHKPRQTRSLAVHAIQTGYRPDDPYKRAYLSFWMGADKDGKSRGCTPKADRFELLDAASKTIFSGKAELVKADGAEEQISIHEKLDYTKSAVYRLDFSAFSVPGEYRVFVPGIGTSGPLRIAADVWDVPFKAAMQGILAQRQGIDLGPPACSFTRRRAFHPDDGVVFYQLDIPHQAGEEGVRGKRMIELMKDGPMKSTRVVPGGYQDAGDWDTAGHHLSATYDLLGLYDLNPTGFSKAKASLPAAELQNGLPGILNEAMWQMPMWKSLQLRDGGVRGGYGDGWGCYQGETSSMLKYAGVYSVDHDTTLRYAASAARAARVLTAFDRKLAAEYLESAKCAWAWAEAHTKADDEVYIKVLALDTGLPKHLRDLRAMAAVELLAATRDAAYDAAFKQSTELSGNGGLYLEQPGADFAYARLPANLGDPDLKKRAVARITAYADHAIAFSQKNAYDIIAGHRTDMPMIFVSRFFSTPGAGGFSLIYAYELTKKPAYLAAAVQGANYSLGANPDNLSYCCGVGYGAEHFPFFVDVWNTGQYPDVPVGHIPFGQGNEGSASARGANGWVQTWLLNFGPTKKMVPNWYDWPVTEQYIDFGRYPLHNETCFNQTTVPAACYWFYLATRPEL
jgi:endoglucanase